MDKLAHKYVLIWNGKNSDIVINHLKFSTHVRNIICNEFLVDFNSFVNGNE